MERVDDFRFRFLRGINVGPVGDDDLDGSNPDAFYRYNRWLQGETQGDYSVQPGECKLEASIDKELEHVAMSTEELEARWIDCRPNLNRAALEVDLTPRLYKFSMNQARMGSECWMRARSQRSSTDDCLSVRSVNFFRSALRTVCYEATLHGLDGLSRWHQELCEEKERMKGSLFRYCARTLRQGEECWEVWRKLLEVRRELIEDSKPEMRIAEMMCLVSSGPQRSIYDRFRRLSFGTASKKYGSQGSASEMPFFRQSVAKSAKRHGLIAVPLHGTTILRTISIPKFGMLLRDGAYGVESKPAEAARLIRRAANAGNVSALNKLGMLLRNGGDCIESYPAEAAKLFR